MVEPPVLGVESFDGDGLGRARAHTGRSETGTEPGLAHVALRDDATIGLEGRHRVRAVPRAVLATNAVVGVMLNDTIRELLVGVGRASLQARWFEAMVARHREVKTFGVRVIATLDLAHPTPCRAVGQPVLLGTSDLAGVATNARVHAEAEAVLLAGLKRKQLGPSVGDPMFVTDLGRRLQRKRDLGQGHVRPVMSRRLRSRHPRLAPHGLRRKRLRRRGSDPSADRSVVCTSARRR